MTEHSEKAAVLGVPSLVWRAGQKRRLQMILDAAGERVRGTVFDNGCGVGQYVAHLTPLGGSVIGLEYDFEQVLEAKTRGDKLFQGAGEHLPLPDNSCDLILSHEVIEHVQNDGDAVREMVRTLKPGGRIVLFCPNRGYPVETHGIYWRGKYYFGNKPFVNWLPMFLRNKLAPHVRIYTARSLAKLFEGLPVRFVTRTIIFGAYDNLIARFGPLARVLRWTLQTMEKTPLKILGLSHFWVVEKLKVEG
ncbi:MAG TPA: class I SAM-dependent methyltransferase [Anaerolineales bacterium]|nr:class I SAM-dependent methyltransferase [Anaerolineales bacterium]